MPQTYTLDEFTTGAWSDRPEYSSEQICFKHITQLHKVSDDFVESGKCGETDYWFFLTMRSEVTFEFYLYDACSWREIGVVPLEAEPFVWVYGTVFDGVRECSGGENFSGNLKNMAQALGWLHSDCCRRWPRFAKWYD